MSLEQHILHATKIANTSSGGILGSIRIMNGYCMSTNGRLAYTFYAPELKGIDVTVPVDRLQAALNACKYAPTISVGDKFMTVRRERFKARLPLHDSTKFPIFMSDAKPAEITTAQLNAVSSLVPFISRDASRPWANGILFTATHAIATNNIVVIRTPLQTSCDTFCLPYFTFEIIAKLKERIVSMALDQSTAKLTLENGGVLFSKLMSIQWPDINAVIKPVPADSVPDDLIDSIKAVAPLCDKLALPTVHMGPDGIWTPAADTQAACGGIALPRCAFAIEPLLSVLRVASVIDFTTYPKPCYFKSVANNIDGMISGVRF